MNNPFRKINKAERDLKRLVNTPQREMGQVKREAGRMKRMPGQKARMMKNQALAPARQLKGQARRMSSQGRRYKRYGKRMSGTDFMVSAMLYPTGFLTLFAGMIDDWDTQFIRYHLVHARMLWVFMIILFPLGPFIWLYSWFLGFQAYSGKKPRVPVLTNWAEKRGKLNLEEPEE